MSTMSMDSMTTGVSAQEAVNYLNRLQEAFAEAKKRVNETEDLFQTLRQGWSGQGEIDFENRLNTANQTLLQAIDDSYAGTESLVASLVEDVVNLDASFVSGNGQ